MLEQITWNNYFTAVAIILVIYYLLIALLYYRGEISEKINRYMKSGTVAPEEIEDESSTGSSAFNELEAIVAGIKGILEEAGKEAGKEELLERLGNILASYEGLGSPAFRGAINNYIIGHAEKICAVSFDEEELNRHWQKIRS